MANTNNRLWMTVLACGSVALGCTGDGNRVDAGPVSAACPASHNVGYQELTFVDSARGRPLNTAIWYPTNDGQANTSGQIAGAAPARSSGPYPLIMASHGMCSSNQEATVFKKDWARHGFVVATPDHQYNTYDDCDLSYQAMMQFARPIDIRFVLDQVLSLNDDPASFLHGMIDSESIGMTGESFGGHTTLMVAGATPNLDYLAEYCEINPGSWDICTMQDQIQQLYPGQRIIDESDPRMKAALPIVADGYGWFRESEMAKIKIPIMLMGGEQDTAAPPELQQKLMYQAIESTKYLFIQNDAAHFSFLDRCGDDIDLYPLCSTLHAQSIPTTTAFWMLYLKNDSTCGDLLQTWVPSLSNLLYRSEAAIAPDAGG